MKKISLTLSLLLVLSACQHNFKSNNEDKQQQAHPFIKSLSQHCGKSYYGETVFPDDPGHDFAGKTLLMEVKECSPEEVRIAFAVGEDRSRTWIISETPKGLLLKHDHRHKDGTPDELTMYGGYANDKGTALKQYFAADEDTQKMIPEASTNVWMMELDGKKGEFVYYLERHDKPRYKAKFEIK